MSQAVIENPSVINDEDRAAITDFASALGLLKALNIEVEKASEYGTGFAVEKNKDKLIGVDFVILSWRFAVGDYVDTTGDNGEFVAAEIVTRHDEKLVIVDGGTGIYKQLRMVTSQRIEKGHAHPQAGLFVDGGLTKSTYFRNKNGDVSKTAKAGYEPGTTHYLSA